MAENAELVLKPCGHIRYCL